MTVAEDAREAVRASPFLYEALRAGVLNYTAAARYLDVGEQEAVAAALRRYREDLPDREPAHGSARITMHSGVGPDADDPLLVVGDAALAADGGDLTAVVATGDVAPADLARVLARLDVADVAVEAAGASPGHLVVAVSRRAGVDALRLVEETLP